VAHEVNSTVAAKVNSLTSVATGLKFNFYDLSLLQAGGGHQRSDENLGSSWRGT